MKYRNLLSAVLLISLVCLINVDAGNKRRKTKPQRTRVRNTYKLEIDLCYDFSVQGETSKIKFITVLPRTLPRRQRIYSIEYSSEPSRLFSKNGNDYAEFVFVKPQKQFKLEIIVKAKLFKYDLFTARNRQNPILIKGFDPNDFLNHEKNIEKDDPLIQQIKRGIRSGVKTATLKNIYDYVIKNMKYKCDRKSSGALYAAKTKTGECSEYADLFVALCRAKKIPARTVSGYVKEEALAPKHAWTEVYLRKYGWVPFDPTWGDVVNKSADQFHKMQPIYIYLSGIRNDEVLNNRWYFTYRWRGGSVTVKDSIKFKSLSE